MEKFCLECNEPLLGRVDKKFCNDSCRNTYNNRKKNSEANRYVKRVNGILSHNRHVLASLNPAGRKKVHKADLADKGFDFGFMTHVYRTKSGAICYFCYDQGYFALGNNYYLLIRKER
jgi:hypothetical protein